MAKDQGRSNNRKNSSEEAPVTRRQLLRAAVGVGGGLLVSGLHGCAEGPQRMPDAGSKGTVETAATSGSPVGQSSTEPSGNPHFRQPRRPHCATNQPATAATNSKTMGRAVAESPNSRPAANSQRAAPCACAKQHRAARFKKVIGAAVSSAPS